MLVAVLSWIYIVGITIFFILFVLTRGEEARMVINSPVEPLYEEGSSSSEESSAYPSSISDYLEDSDSSEYSDSSLENE